MNHSKEVVGMRVKPNANDARVAVGCFAGRTDDYPPDDRGRRENPCRRVEAPLLIRLHGRTEGSNLLRTV